MTLGPLAKQKGLSLEVAASNAPPITSDRRAVRQILINLVNNAIKFTDEGSVRMVLTRERDTGGEIARVAVVDTGHGIREEDQEHLFAAFEQIGGATAQPYEGTGLGAEHLPDDRSAADATITFESEFGSGATFTLELRGGDA